MKKPHTTKCSLCLLPLPFIWVVEVPEHIVSVNKPILACSSASWLFLKKFILKNGIVPFVNVFLVFVFFSIIFFRKVLL